MRFLIFAVLLCLGACGSGPQALGLTGPGAQREQAKPAEEAIPGGDLRMQQTTPNSGNGAFWGYN